MLQTPADHILDSVADLFPGGMEGLCRFLPGEFSGPSGQEQPVCLGKMMLAVAPGHFFDHHAATAALHAAHAVEKENQQSPEGNELEAPFGQVVVTGRRLVAARADGRRTITGPDFDLNARFVLGPSGWLIDESPVAIAVI
jgi:hypothetical protein